jgi:hypothetical protein
MTASRLIALVALAFCFVAGYFVADFWSRRDTSPLTQICARVDYAPAIASEIEIASASPGNLDLRRVQNLRLGGLLTLRDCPLRQQTGGLPAEGARLIENIGPRNKRIYVAMGRFLR